MKKFYIKFALVVTPFFTFAQQQPKTVIHTVESGQTIFSIAKAYQQKPEDIKRSNPDLDDSYKIKPGQAILITIPEVTPVTTASQQLMKNSVDHNVTYGDTLYSLSNFYNVSVEDLKKWNNIESNVIKEGQNLIVGYNYSNKFSENDDLVLPSTTITEQEISVYTTPGNPSSTSTTIQPAETYPVATEPAVTVSTETEVTTPVVTTPATTTPIITSSPTSTTTTTTIEPAETYPVATPQPTNTSTVTTNEQVIVHSTEISPQVVTVSKPSPSEPIAKSIDESVQPKTKVTEPKPPVKVVSSAPKKLTKQEKLRNKFNEQKSSAKLTHAEGKAIWIVSKNRMMNATYYGMFSDVPVGTVVRVQNMNNNRSVYVKVIGSLPNTKENTGALIKLTPAVQKALKTSDAKVRVKVFYAK